MIPGECLKPQTRWRSGLDSNSRYQLAYVCDGLLTAYKVARGFEIRLAQTARERVISDYEWSRRTPSEALIVGIPQNLSARDFAGSVGKATLSSPVLLLVRGMVFSKS
jgi:hypothetical protein